MTLEDKVLQMQNSAPAIPRLGVPVYNWWNKALHGVASGRATVFPEPIGLGAMWECRPRPSCRGRDFYGSSRQIP
jgi:beta-glucosidase